MKQTKQTNPVKVLYEHLSVVYDGIRIDIVVDYYNMSVSLVDSNRKTHNYMFMGRTLDYEQSRYNILEAMKKAMQLGFNKLRMRQEENDIKYGKQVMSLQK